MTEEGLILTPEEKRVGLDIKIEIASSEHPESKVQADKIMKFLEIDGVREHLYRILLEELMKMMNAEEFGDA